MAAPNIVNVTAIRGNTAVLNVSTTAANIVVNPASSGKVFKVNTIIVSNMDGVNASDANVSLMRGGIGYSIATTVTVPADATLVVVSKDTSIYLQEGDTIVVGATNANRLQAICSYEEIS